MQQLETRWLLSGALIDTTPVATVNTVEGNQAGTVATFTDTSPPPQQFTTLDPPGSVSTVAARVLDHYVVGYYTDGFSHTHGFLYDMWTATYTTIDAPGAKSTFAFGISTFEGEVGSGDGGYNIVGSYMDANDVWHGFIDLFHTEFVAPGTQSFISIDVSGAFFTEAIAVSGGLVTGDYVDASGTHGFLWNLYAPFAGPDNASFDVPNSIDTLVTGMTAAYSPAESGLPALASYRVAGYYQQYGGGPGNVYLATYGFVYDGSTFTTLGAQGVDQTLFATGTSADSAVGYFVKGSVVVASGPSGTTEADLTSAFLDNPSSPSLFPYTRLDYPFALQTQAYAVDQHEVVGAYTDAYSFAPSGNSFLWYILHPGSTESPPPFFSAVHGFVYDIPTQTYVSIDAPGAESTFPSGIVSGESVGGSTYESVVGTYIDAGGRSHGFLCRPTPVDISASIDWGGPLTGPAPTTEVRTVAWSFASSTWEVFSWWAYAQPGDYTVTVTVQDGQGDSLRMGDTTFNVADAPLTDTTPVRDAPLAPGETANWILATFTDGNPYATPSDFTPSVDWGGALIGTPTVSVQLLSQSPGGSTWVVVGNPTYAAPGHYTPTVTVADGDGSSLQTSNTSFEVAAPLADTTPVTTVNAVAGSTTATVVLATFTESARYLAVDPPGAVSASVAGVSGGKSVGTYQDGAGVSHAFLYDGMSYATIDPPGAISASAVGVDGNMVVGDYTDGSNVQHGFIYNGSTFLTIDPPDSTKTSVAGISGSYVAGTYVDENGIEHGFLYDGVAYTTLDPPDSTQTSITGISFLFDGFLSLSGDYVDTLGIQHGFSYSGGIYTTVDPAGSTQTSVTGVAGAYVVGSYIDSSGVSNGFIYDGATYATIAPPGSTEATITEISGSDIVGEYSDGSGVRHGFLYDGSSYITLDAPNGIDTEPRSISGRNVAGYYIDGSGATRGFLFLTAADPSQFTTSVDWEGPLLATPAVSLKRLSQSNLGSTWEVLGSATYAAPGDYTPSVGVGDPWGGHIQSGGTTFHVVDPLTDTTPVTTVTARAGVSTGDVVLATFSEAAQYIAIRPLGAVFSAVEGISDGRVVGYYQDSAFHEHAFVYDGASYSTIDPPGAIWAFASGVDGDTIVGYYSAGGASHGFVYDGSAFTTIDPPGSTGTIVDRISGSKIVGEYYDAAQIRHGFLYDGSAYFTIDPPPGTPPGSYLMSIDAVSGDLVVGHYFDNLSGQYSIVYDVANGTYLTIAVPGATTTDVTSVSGSDVVGNYYDTTGVRHGFLYDGTTYTTIDPPGSSQTQVTGISGTDLIGTYTDGNGAEHGFLYDGVAYTTLDDPAAAFTYPKSISGGNVTGFYIDADGGSHSFLYLTAADPFQFAASVNWGGAAIGSPAVSVNRLSQSATGGTWEVVGSATYAAQGDYTTTVSVADAFGAGVQTSNTSFHVVNPLTDTTPAATLSATEGRTTGTVVLATFSDANPAALLAEFATQVNWGGTVRGTPSVSVQLVSRSASASSWEVLGSAIYAEKGLYTVTVSISDGNGNSIHTSNTQFKVADAPLIDTTPARTLNATNGKATGYVVLATFNDGNPYATAADFNISVDWGTAVSGTPKVTLLLMSRTATGSNWEVVANVTFLADGLFTPVLTIDDSDGNALTTQKTKFNVTG